MPVLAVDKWYFDDELKGFCLKVCANTGKKSYYYQYKNYGRRKKFRIGTHGQLAPKQARDVAKTVAGQVAMGQDPHTDRRRAKGKNKTLGDLIKEFATHRLPKLKLNTQLTYKPVFAKIQQHHLNTLELDQIQTSKLTALHTQITETSGPTAANQFIRKLVAIFNFAIDQEYLVKNPASRVDQVTEKSRERQADLGELAALKRGVAEEVNPSIRGLFKLLFYTGCRSSEIRELRWEHVNFEEGYFDIPVTKSDRMHRVYMNKGALLVLSKELPKISGNPFCLVGGKADHPLSRAAMPKYWDRVLAKSGVKDFHIHDIRRTVASLLVSHGVHPTVIGAVLNHKGNVQTATAIYAKASPEDKRKAFAAIYDLVGPI